MDRMISRANIDDWPRARDIRLRSLLEAPQAYGSSYEREIAFSNTDWEERVATAHTYLAIEGQETVGTATALWTRDGDMHLVAMYVVSQARGTGCAHELIDAVVSVAERRGALRVVLGVAEGNDRAARCYARYGFVPTGRRLSSTNRPELTEIEYDYPLDQPGRVSVPG